MVLCPVVSPRSIIYSLISSPASPDPSLYQPAQPISCIPILRASVSIEALLVELGAMPGTVVSFSAEPLRCSLHKLRGVTIPALVRLTTMRWFNYYQESCMLCAPSCADPNDATFVGVPASFETMHFLAARICTSVCLSLSCLFL